MVIGKKKYNISNSHKQLYKSLSKEGMNSRFFLRIRHFIKNDKKLKEFLFFIENKDHVSSNEIYEFFNTKKIIIKKGHKCKAWNNFLNKHLFKKDYNMFFHDIVGHIILKNDITSKGEILATAGMCGFSFELGKFYFINAILIFSLGYQLFDDTTSSYLDISKHIRDINIAYKKGEKLRKFLNFNEKLLNSLSIEEFLLKKCKYIKRFKNVNI